ncbi:MAG: helix-turn-helix transcriptional regulator [Novosphingobium sp.]|nr:helix-turn-helix transcriptional regulator [Novosphingobium sp.]
MVLGILSETGPHHGYDLIGKFSERSGEAYAPSPGVLYPLLTMLAEMDLIEETEAGGNKREYRIADAGRAQIEKDRENLDAAFARLDTLRTHARRTNAGPVRRAMGNLRTAAMQRLSAENADEELTFAVAAILDEAAQKIERL